MASILLLFLGLLSLRTVATRQEDAAADTVAAVFMKARQAARLAPLERIGTNMFGEKVCKHDMRFSSGLIKNVLYDTSDPSQLPESAQLLATSPDTSKASARFGIGACLQKPNSAGQRTYSILIATYESRWIGFWRIFWE
jgi:hypothetical protein